MGLKLCFCVLNLKSIKVQLTLQLIKHIFQSDEVSLQTANRIIYTYTQKQTIIIIIPPFNAPAVVGTEVFRQSEIQSPLIIQ